MEKEKETRQGTEVEVEVEVEMEMEMVLFLTDGSLRSPPSPTVVALVRGLQESSFLR